jgi:hypothetical protein
LTVRQLPARRADSTPIPAGAPAWAAALRRVTSYLVNDFGGGPRPWKFAWVINFQKTGTFPFLAFLIAWYHNTSTAAWIYLAMHGSYGLVWIIKDLAFPDPAWQQRITILGGINAFLAVLGWYWVFGWLLISGVAEPAYPLPEYAWFCLCVSLCILGCVIMIAADAQKYFTLRLRRGLLGLSPFRPPGPADGLAGDLHFPRAGQAADRGEVVAQAQGQQEGAGLWRFCGVGFWGEVRSRVQRLLDVRA